jgi:hypothetical protein
VPAGDPAHGLKFLLGGLKGGLQPGDLAEPAFAASFADAGLQVVADLQQPGLLGWLRAELRAPDTAVLMDARSPEVPGADSQGDLAELEVVQELIPLFGGEITVLFTGANGAPAGDEWLWRFRLAPPWRSEVAPPDGWRGYGVLMAA